MSALPPRPGNAHSGSASPRPPRRGDILDGLGEGWSLLQDCTIGGGRSAPARIDLALLHPRIGVVLLERPPRWAADAPNRLRRRLDIARFSAIFPGFLPVAHLQLRRQDLTRLPLLLADAFAAQPPLALPGGDAWMSAVRPALRDGIGPGALHDAPDDPGWAIPRAAPGPVSRRGPAVAASLGVLAGILTVFVLPRPGAVPPVAKLDAAVPRTIGALASWSVAEAAGTSNSQAGGPEVAVAAERDLAADDDAAAAPVPDSGPGPWPAEAATPLAEAGAAPAAPAWLADVPTPPPPASPAAPMVPAAVPLPVPALAGLSVAGPAPGHLPATPPRVHLIPAAPRQAGLLPIAPSGAPPGAVPAPVETTSPPISAQVVPADAAERFLPPALDTPSPTRLVAAPPPQMPPLATPVTGPLAAPLGAALPPTPPAVAPVPRTDPALLAALVRRGDALLAIGDVSAARRFYERAAEAGSAEAAEAAGRTYEAAALQALGARGIQADPEAAANWRRRAAALRQQDQRVGR